MIDPSLIHAYNNTIYHVSHPELVLRIGGLHPSLDKLLLECGKNTWAFITASNPFSNQLSDGVNSARFALLKESVKSYLCFEGKGVGLDPRWKPEQSLLIIGIDESDAIELGKSFEQNAIVFGRIDSVAELVILL